MSTIASGFKSLPAWAGPAAVVAAAWVLWPVLRGARTLGEGVGDALAVPGRLVSGAVDLGGQGFDLVGDVLGSIGSAVADPVRTLGGDVPGSGNAVSRWFDRSVVQYLPEAQAGDSLGTYIFNVLNGEYRK